MRHYVITVSQKKNIEGRSFSPSLHRSRPTVQWQFIAIRRPCLPSTKFVQVVVADINVPLTVDRNISTHTHFQKFVAHYVRRRLTPKRALTNRTIQPNITCQPSLFVVYIVIGVAVVVIAISCISFFFNSVSSTPPLPHHHHHLSSNAMRCSLSLSL